MTATNPESGHRGVRGSELALDVSELRVALTSGSPIVDGVSWRVAQSEILGLVGESGSGKTTAALALLGYARPGVRIVGGSVCVAGQQMVGLSDPALRRLRGKLVSYVPRTLASH